MSIVNPREVPPRATAGAVSPPTAGLPPGPASGEFALSRRFVAGIPLPKHKLSQFYRRQAASPYQEVDNAADSWNKKKEKRDRHAALPSTSSAKQRTWS